MKDAQKPDHTSLNNLVRWLKEGKYVIPDFQRDFEWKPWDVRDLMRSIFLDYYIGSLLLWKGTNNNFESLACEPIYGFEEESNPEYIVLDGQQRLTALFQSLFYGKPVKTRDARKNAIERLYYLHIPTALDPNADQEDAILSIPANKKILNFGWMN